MPMAFFFVMSSFMMMTVAMSMVVAVSVVMIVTLMQNIHHNNVENEAQNCSDKHDTSINSVLHENPVECFYNKPNCENQKENDRNDCSNYFTSLPSISIAL
jgi:hypothetical protein